MAAARNSRQHTGNLKSQMTAERWRQIERLFLQALECSPADRSGFLESVCENDTDLRTQLESLLASDAPQQPLIEIPEVVTAALDTDLNSDLQGVRAGAYRLIRLLGHGGHGIGLSG